MPSLKSTTHLFPLTIKQKTWQDRMVSHYHSHLYKEYVLADMTRAPAMLGLRWRTREEVQNGRGHATCGNKHCPGSSHVLESSKATQTLLSNYYESPRPTSNEHEERLLDKLPHGIGLHDYEVPFTYTEQGETKTELVKLRLCMRCSPMLFKGGALEARRARNKRDDNGNNEIASSGSDNDSAHEVVQKRRMDSSDESSVQGRKRKRRRQKKRKKKTSKRRQGEMSQKTEP